MDNECFEEELTLAREYKWLLHTETQRTFQELASILIVAWDFLVPNVTKSKSKTEKFVTNSQSSATCIFCLEGHTVTEADVNIKVLRHGNQLTVYHARVNPDLPWKLSQMQEAANHLSEALQLAEAAMELPNHKKALKDIDSLIGFLRKGRDALLVPSKSPLFSSNSKFKNACFIPPLPSDLEIQFSVQSPKVVCSVFQLLTNQRGKPIFSNKINMETIVPRLNDVMLIINRAFNLCQMLKDKFAFFLKIRPELLELKQDGDDDDITGTSKEFDNTFNIKL